MSSPGPGSPGSPPESPDPGTGAFARSSRVSWGAWAAFNAWLVSKAPSPEFALRALGKMGLPLAQATFDVESVSDGQEQLSGRTQGRIEALVEALAQEDGQVSLPALDPFLDPLRGAWPRAGLNGMKVPDPNPTLPPKHSNSPPLLLQGRPGSDLRRCRPNGRCG